MGYLHARGVIHKGLNTKNIFIEKTTDKKDKVVITDMGLSGLSSSIWSRYTVCVPCISAGRYTVHVFDSLVTMIVY